MLDCSITSRQRSKSRNQLCFQHYCPIHRLHSNQLSLQRTFSLLVQNLLQECILHLTLCFHCPPIWNSSSISPLFCILNSSKGCGPYLLQDTPPAWYFLVPDSSLLSWSARPQAWCRVSTYVSGGSLEMLTVVPGRVGICQLSLP